MATALVWFRNDLRLADNPALQAALDGGYTPVPVYIHAPSEHGEWAPGAASNAWLHRSLDALSGTLEERGSRLRLFVGPSLDTLETLVAATGAEAVFWNRRYEPALEQRDTRIKKALRQQGLHVESFNSALLLEPWTVSTKQGTPFRVFTPFWKAALAQWRIPACEAAPASLPSSDAGPAGVSLDALKLAPALDWDRAFWTHWQPGEAGAEDALEAFVEGALHAYADDRDRPDRIGTSRLSPHLHFGEIAAWRVVHTLEESRRAGTAAHIDTAIKELGWREFAHHLLHHFPETPASNFNPRFDGFDWTPPSRADLDAWRAGRTGVPIVDAGLRELWTTGWMHNRVRMIVGSYLTKHMRVHWRHGAEWFWDTLVDADLASNTLGWQWVAGTGADAAPYFRVFNPVTQAEKFDPDGAYIARWVPELAALPVPARSAPWRFPELLRDCAPDYPTHPIVDLAKGRDAALEAYRRQRERAPATG
ncbi:cryptochrome/photolyase family protein [Novilysobacter selenitireducens]|uniref:DNA photolyase family protein n=1 Tax=Novilysobacter selenitireducens TaxID=2872639 RepID=A0ABS7T7X6_9GAMM|nr:deoxyribodipyrimidine photo-lyase [Lysobacter selenitireducens]MBZ4039931.1 DNA photolyase family protein [Lysobacter selenitireducens]